MKYIKFTLATMSVFLVGSDAHAMDQQLTEFAAQTEAKQQRAAASALLERTQQVAADAQLALQLAQEQPANVQKNLEHATAIATQLLRPGLDGNNAGLPPALQNMVWRYAQPN